MRGVRGVADKVGVPLRVTGVVLLWGAEEAEVPEAEERGVPKV